MVPPLQYEPAHAPAMEIGKGFDEISQWLGHATVEQTKRAYAFLRLDDLRVNEVGTTIGTGRQE